MASTWVESSDVPRIYAIGDVHGRLDLLEQMISEIRVDMKERPVAGALTVTLGDYIDRGPHSRGVIDRLVRNPFPTPYVPLKGNHEALFEDFLGQPATADQWRHLGGLETLHSYGVPVSMAMRGKGYEQTADQLRAAVPEAHFRFIASLKVSASFRRYFLCHAGVRPGIPLERQSVDDLLWIRDEFLTSGEDFGKRIVHGHTPNEWPEVLPNRINIDTGAFATGRLTCVVLEGERHRFLFAN